MNFYNEAMDEDTHINTEETIVSLLSEHEYVSGLKPSEDECNYLAREILLSVLIEFRPDLIGSEELASGLG